MKQTGNFQLNQWDPTDRILREDFNRDNKTIDAALAPLRDLDAAALGEGGLGAALAALAGGKPGRPELISVKDLSGGVLFQSGFHQLDWKDWEFFAVYVQPLCDPDSGGTVTLKASGQPIYETQKYPALTLFWPGRDPERQVKALVLSKPLTDIVTLDMIYRDFDTLGVAFDDVTPAYVKHFGVR